MSLHFQFVVVGWPFPVITLLSTTAAHPACCCSHLSVPIQRLTRQRSKPRVGRQSPASSETGRLWLGRNQIKTQLNFYQQQLSSKFTPGVGKRNNERKFCFLLYLYFRALTLSPFTVKKDTPWCVGKLLLKKIERKGQGKRCKRECLYHKHNLDANRPTKKKKKSLNFHQTYC